MGLIHLPFLKGQDQTVDPKIAPLGVLKSAKNVRFDKQGRIIKRPGFDSLSVETQVVPALGDSLFSNGYETGIGALFERGGQAVAIAGGRVCSYSQAADQWRDWNPVTPWSAPERFEMGGNVLGRALRPSVAYTNGYVCAVFESNDGVSFRVYAAVYDATTMEMVSFAQFAAGNAKRPRVIAMGTRFAVVYLNTQPTPDTLAFTTFNTASISSSWRSEEHPSELQSPCNLAC